MLCVNVQTYPVYKSPCIVKSHSYTTLPLCVYIIGPKRNLQKAALINDDIFTLDQSQLSTTHHIVSIY